MFRKIKKNFKLILYSTFLWGIFAHGMMIFNKFSYHDDAGLFEYGLTYSLGRWMLGLIGDFVTFLFVLRIFNRFRPDLLLHSLQESPCCWWICLRLKING